MRWIWAAVLSSWMMIVGLGTLWLLPPEADAERVAKLVSYLPFATIVPTTVTAAVEYAGARATLVKVSAEVTMHRPCLDATATQSVFRVARETEQGKWLKSVDPIRQTRGKQITGDNMALVGFSEVVHLDPPLEPGAYLLEFLVVCEDYPSLPVQFSTPIWYVAGGSEEQ